MGRGSSQPRRHRMRKPARCESALAWVASGAPVGVKAYARRYGVDRYTAREDLLAVGYRFPPGDNRWSVRPPGVPKKRKPVEPPDVDLDWIYVGDQRMFVVGYTSGGAPFGYVEGLDDREDD